MKAAGRSVRLLVILALLAVGAVSGQRDSTPTQSSKPEVFAPGVVSTGNEFGLTFMPDGKEAFFTRFDAERKINHIYSTLLKHGAWQPPTLVGVSRDEWRDLDPAVSPDGKRLFFVSNRPKPNANQGVPSPDMDIWVADRDGGGWGTPHWVEYVNSDAKEGSPSLARDGTLYFFSNRGAAPDANAVYSAKLVNGRYVAPERLPAEVNAGPSDTSPFISPDGQTLLFYSTRAGGYGKGDIYVASQKRGRWTQAVNIGPVVNTQDGEYNPSISPDGKQLYFGRNRYIYVLTLRAVGLNSLQPAQFR